MDRDAPFATPGQRMREMKEAGPWRISGWYTNQNDARSHLLDCVIPTIEKRLARTPASRNEVGTAIYPIRSYRGIICLSVSLRQRPPGFGVAPLYCEFRAIIVVRLVSRTCAAYTLRQCFESLAPVLGLFALSIPNQQFQLTSHCRLLRGCYAKHNSFSWDSKLLPNKLGDYGSHQPCTSDFRAFDALPAVCFQFMVSAEHRMSRRNVTRYSQRRSKPYGNPKG